jgi:CHAD domain-containing protein
VRPEEPIDAALERSVGEHVAKLKKRLRRAEDAEPEGVHDARTSLRRVREDLVVMGETVFDRDRAAALEDALHELEKALSKPRDADVMLGLVRAHGEQHRTDRAGLAELEARLQDRRERSARRARKLLRADGRAVVRDVRKLLSSAGDAAAGGCGDPSKAAPRLVHHFTREAIYRAYDGVLAYDTKHAPDVESLHRFRSACRRLRYAFELFDEALDGGERIVRELRGAQDDVGQMHDHHVAATRVETWVRDGKLRATAELERFVEAREREREALRERALRRFEAILGGGFRASLASAIDGAVCARAA